MILIKEQILPRKRLTRLYKDDVRNYEVALIISQKLSEEELKKFLESTKQIIRELGANIVNISTTKIRTFAYPINHSKQGYYSCFYIKSKAEEINEIRKRLSFEENILRILVTLSNSKKQSYGIFNPEYEESEKRDKTIAYDHPNFLSKFLGEIAKIEKGKNTEIKNMRKISKAIKISRYFSILPYKED